MLTLSANDIRLPTLEKRKCNYFPILCEGIAEIPWLFYEKLHFCWEDLAFDAADAAHNANVKFHKYLKHLSLKSPKVAPGK